MTKRNVGYTYKGILLSLKKKGHSATTQMNLGDIVANEINQTPKDKCHTIPLMGEPRAVKFTETESRLGVPGGWGRGEWRESYY